MSSDANNYDNLTMCNEQDWERFMSYEFDGRGLKEVWVPFHVKEIKERKNSDIPSFSAGAPVLSICAVEKLAPYLNDNVEVLPIHCIKGDYCIINVTNVIDCIDYEKSEVKRFKSSGRIMRFIKYSFKPETIRNEHIFKIADYAGGHVFVSDEFKNIVEASDLKGFLFEEVWSL